MLVTRALYIISFFVVIEQCVGIKCYQCSTEEDAAGQDLCGAYEGFRPHEHVPVDCLGDDSHTPGTFCVKVTKQSPRSFIWDGRWRWVIRRCASVTETGVTNVCNWGVDPAGIYYEECYCTSDSCNGGVAVTGGVGVLLLLVLGVLLHQRQL